MSDVAVRMVFVLLSVVSNVKPSYCWQEELVAVYTRNATDAVMYKLCVQLLKHGHFCGINEP